MSYNTIPIPSFNFADLIENRANQFYKSYMYGNFINLDLEVLLKEIKSLIWNQNTSGDKIIVISFLINKISEKIFTLPDGAVDEDYKEILFELYRAIENEGIEIPTDLFSKEDYIHAEQLLLNIHTSIENLKVDNPLQKDALTEVQAEVKKSKKFLWMGKEDWAKILIGGIVNASIKEGIVPFLPTILSFCQTFLTNLLIK